MMLKLLKSLWFGTCLLFSQLSISAIEIILDSDLVNLNEEVSEETDFESQEHPEELDIDTFLGSINGQVYDKESGETLHGVVILIEGTDYATISDSDGAYGIAAIEAGIYDLTYFKDGYIEAKVTDTRVVKGEATTLNFALPRRPVEMSDDVYQLQDFVVTAEEANDLFQQLELQKLSLTQLDIMSADEFSKFAASDIADAVKNIAGVSISDGKYAVIRGLNDRYTVTKLSGNIMPSPDPDRAAVPLDVFPTGIFGSVETSKTYSVKMPANASGGLIDLKLLELSDDRVMKYSLSSGYNENSNEKWMGSKKIHFADYFGRGASKRSLLEDFTVTESFSNNSEGIEDWGEFNGNYEVAFDSLLPIYQSPKPNFGASFLYGDNFKMSDGSKLGVFFAVQQRSNSSFNEVSVGKLASATANDADSNNFTGNYFAKEWGGLRENASFEGQSALVAGISFEMNASSKLDFHFLNTNTGIDSVSKNTAGYRWGDGGQGSTVTFNEADSNQDGRITVDDSYNQTERVFIDGEWEEETVTYEGLDEIYQKDIRGLDYLSFDYIQRTMSAYLINWNYQDDTSGNLETFNISNAKIYNEQDEPFNFDSRGPLPPTFSSRLTQQESDALAVDSTFRLAELLSNELMLNLGFHRDESIRNFVQKQVSYETVNGFEDGMITATKEPQNYGITGEASGYRDIESFYGELFFKLYDTLNFSAGSRRVKSELAYDGSGKIVQAGEFAPEVIELYPINDIDWLSSFHVNYNVNEELKLKTSFSKTIARPSYRELQPFPILNPLTNELEVGNSGYIAQPSGTGTNNPVIEDIYADFRGLKIAGIENFDIRLEYYANNGGFFAIGSFNKTVDQPIERIEAFGQTATVPVFTYINNENNADLKGFEVEFQQNLGELFGKNIFDDVNIGGNFTKIDAEIKRSVVELRNPSIKDIDVFRADAVRPLFDQPDYLANIFASVNLDRWGTDFTLSLNQTGKRLKGALSTSALDIYEDSVSNLNLVITQKLPFLQNSKMKFSAKNLTDSTYRRYTESSDEGLLIRDEVGNSVDEYSLLEYKKGRSYSLSFSYEF